MSEELRAFLDFCKTEKLKLAEKNENVHISVFKVDKKDNKAGLVLNDLTYKQYYAIECMYKIVYSQPFDPVEYGIILSDSLN